jgi:hypothetical protein
METPIHRVTIAKIEAGGERAENVTLREVFALGAALSVAPVYLFFPLDENELIAISGDPRHVLRAMEARDWLRGALPLEGGDTASYFGERPTEEVRALLELRDRLERGELPPMPKEEEQ